MKKMQSIPVFILAGGLGTRLSEETHLRPKPMIEIGDAPILLHIMRWYYSFGFNDFVICAGYRSWEIKQFFLTYEYRLNHIGIDTRTSVGQPALTQGKNNTQEKWRVRVFDTGQDSMTGSRIAKAFDQISEEEEISTFAVTYGDGVTDLDLSKEIEFHEKHGRIGTVLGVPAMARFGELDVESGGKVAGFIEKPEEKQGLINGGFFFFDAKFRKYISTNTDCILERAPLFQLAKEGQLMTYEYRGFWRPMDTLRDKIFLQELWDSRKAPWYPKYLKDGL